MGTPDFHQSPTLPFLMVILPTPVGLLTVPYLFPKLVSRFKYNYVDAIFMPLFWLGK